ncbi:Protein of unknown function (DUF1778) [Photorhabdus khanii NC19]|uniref:Uncharacterized protein n=1 Tax=Photorhabdus khanii NC19 TaxID=1004151 RepID=W3VAL6_9GAMM|nr:DUF1778 domain-containing protein [Photorhabdus khanii]ETS32150.1 Protein of unknown function (DUF1778) [Photorhabdus khanii NC19]
MTAVTRFDLKMDIDEKEVISRAAALMGTTIAAFVHTAANRAGSHFKLNYFVN